MKKGLRSLIITALAMMVLTLSCFAAGKTFKDVPEKSWYTEAVAFVSEKGYMDGISKERFDPEGQVTRAQVAQILYALEGKPSTNKVLFPDAPVGKWYSNAVNWAGATGIVAGYESGKFGPNDPVTRQQLAAILFKYSEKKGYDTTAKGDISKYKDVGKVSKYAVTPMKWAVGNKLISGTNIGLEPTGTATRAQLAVILQAFEKNISSKDSNQDSDIPETSLVPYIGNNGNWWIGDEDTGIKAAGKDGKDGTNGKDGANGKDGVNGKDGANGKDGVNGKDGANGKDGVNGKDGANGKDGTNGKDGANGQDGLTPFIGDNGNWWIGDQDTGIKAAAEAADLEEMEIGDELKFLPSTAFSWKNGNGEVITFDDIEIKLYAKDDFEEVAKDASKGFYHNVPSDTTYSERAYWQYEGRYHPYIFRTEIRGHVDPSFAGKIVTMAIRRSETDGYDYEYVAPVEDDGSFTVVYYQQHYYSGAYLFVDAYIVEPNPQIGYNGYLKKFDDSIQNVRVFVSPYKEYISPDVVLTLSGTDIHGKSVNISRGIYDDDDSAYVIFKDVPVSDRNGYTLTASGIPGTTAPVTIARNNSIYPSDEYGNSDIWIEAGALQDNRVGKVIVKLDCDAPDLYDWLAIYNNLELRIAGYDINGKYIDSWVTIQKGETEITFDDLPLSGDEPYTLYLISNSYLEFTSDVTVAVNEEKTYTVTAKVTKSTINWTLHIETPDGLQDGYTVVVEDDESKETQTGVTDSEGSVSFTVATGVYNVYIENIPDRYEQHEGAWEQIDMFPATTVDTYYSFSLADTGG